MDLAQKRHSLLAPYNFWRKKKRVKSVNFTLQVELNKKKSVSLLHVPSSYNLRKQWQKCEIGLK